VGEPKFDWDYSITVDRSEIESAAKNARTMIKILEGAAASKDPKKVGFQEADCLSLVDYFLTVGNWSRGANYASSTSRKFTIHGKPRSVGGGQKYSQLLLSWLRKFVIAWDPKDRRGAFNEIEALMYDFVWAFQQKLLEDGPDRASKFTTDLQKLLNTDYAKNYKLRW
jgi:hypothetical protein